MNAALKTAIHPTTQSQSRHQESTETQDMESLCHQLAGIMSQPTFTDKQQFKDCRVYYSPPLISAKKMVSDHQSSKVTEQLFDSQPKY